LTNSRSDNMAERVHRLQSDSETYDKAPIGHHPARDQPHTASRLYAGYGAR
jgi:hypothetical protein